MSPGKGANNTMRKRQVLSRVLQSFKESGIIFLYPLSILINQEITFN